MYVDMHMSLLKNTLKRAKFAVKLPNFSFSQRFSQTKAVRIEQHGGPDVLKYQTTELRNLNDGEVLIRNKYAGLNFIDTYQRSGLYKIELPTTLGVDGSGIVEETTPKAQQDYNLNVGDRVSYYDLGSYSEYKILNGTKAIPLPNEISYETAAACVVQGMTAHYLARSTYNLTSNDWCIIHAAAGGVGQLLVQIAKAQGATVIGTASNKTKQDFALSLGADYACNYSELPDLLKNVRSSGVNVVYDGVGKSTSEMSLNSLCPRGMCVFYGNASGPVPPVDPLLLSKNGSIYLTRPVLAHHVLSRDELLWRSQELFDWIKNDQLKINIDNIYSLSQVQEAHQYIQDGKTMGKVIFEC